MGVYSVVTPPETGSGSLCPGFVSTAARLLGTNLQVSDANGRHVAVTRVVCWTVLLTCRLVPLTKHFQHSAVSALLVATPSERRKNYTSCLPSTPRATRFLVRVSSHITASSILVMARAFSRQGNLTLRNFSR